MTGLLQSCRLRIICFKIIFIFSGAVYICADSGHKLCFTYGCFDSSDTQLCMTLDGDELCYADFKKGTGVWDSKVPTTAHAYWAFQYALACRSVCKHDIRRWKPDKSVTRTKEPPETVLYPRDEVIKDEDNTLICFSNHFFPPKISIKWTKNNKEVTEEDPLIKTISNPDGSFHVFSYLNFAAKQGDIYSCTVEHEALEEPLTRFWEVKTDEVSSGPAVFCGLSLTLGLLGVAVGTFFYVKGNQRYYIPDFSH